MTTEKLRNYLASGGTDMQHLVEWVVVHSTDPVARDLADLLFDNIEAGQ